MTKSLTLAGAILACCLLTPFPGRAAEAALSLDPLQGQWTVTKTNVEGRVYSQVIEIKKDKFVFRLQDADNTVRMVAKGSLKAEKAGPLQLLYFTGIEAGRSQDDLQTVDDDRVLVYALRDDRLYMAANFDRERQNQPPTADAYARMKAAK